VSTSSVLLGRTLTNPFVAFPDEGGSLISCIGGVSPPLIWEALRLKIIGVEPVVTHPTRCGARGSQASILGSYSPLFRRSLDTRNVNSSSSTSGLNERPADVVPVRDMLFTFSGESGSLPARVAFNLHRP